MEKMAKCTIKSGSDSWKSAMKPRGRPPKKHSFTQRELDWIVSADVVKNQGAMTLKARADQLSLLLGKRITAVELGKLYKGRGVSQ